jgi:hypothetical protein
MTESSPFRGIQPPEWALLLDDDSEILAARDRRRVIVTTQADLGLLDPTNAPLITWLVLAQTLYDRSAREVAQNGAVIRPKKGSSRSIARVSPHFQAMTKLNKEILELESHLGPDAANSREGQKDRVSDNPSHNAGRRILAGHPRRTRAAQAD